MAESKIRASELERFGLTLNGYAYFQALAAACELGLFTLLSEHQSLDLHDIAGRLRLPTQSARVLLLSCCALKLLRRDRRKGTYSNTPISENFLVAGSPDDLLPFVRMGWAIQEPGCRYFLDSLKAGTNLGLQAFPGGGETLYGRIAGQPHLEKIFHEGMARFTEQTNEVLKKVSELKSVRSLLDIGGGGGTNAVGLCRAFPDLRATVFDIPSVIEIAAKNIKAEGLCDRITTVPGDAFTDALPGGIDAVLFSHFLEIFSADKIQRLYKKAYKALPAGGKTITWTLSCKDDETGTIQSAKSSIYFLAVASGEGMAYPAADHERWLRESGFSRVRRRRMGEHALLVATK